MKAQARILVATDVTADADLVKKLLTPDFEDVSLSTDADRVVEDFERCRPTVLILAFNTLEKAERYYLGLYRLSKLVHALPHRTVVLCNKDDVRRVFELCRKEYFDDYVLFWPMTHDTVRLSMAVFHALRLAAAAAEPSAHEMAAQARRIAELESLLQQRVAKGGQQVEAANRSLRQAGADIGAALDGFSRKLSEGELRSVVEVKDRRGLQREVDRLKSEEIDRRFEEVAAAVRPMRQWIDALQGELAPQLESARVLGALAERVPPLVLVVDDDEFHNKLLQQALANEALDLVFATSGTEALATLSRRRPDLVFMDLEMPDIGGLEATRRIKATESLAKIPIVMLTGHSEKSVVVESLKSGAVDFVVKPFDRKTLLAKIHKLLRATSD